MKYMMSFSVGAAMGILIVEGIIRANEGDIWGTFIIAVVIGMLGFSWMRLALMGKLDE